MRIHHLLGRNVDLRAQRTLDQKQIDERMVLRLLDEFDRYKEALDNTFGDWRQTYTPVHTPSKYALWDLESRMTDPMDLKSKGLFLSALDISANFIQRSRLT